MALTFFWRCEGLDLDTASGDYSDGDTTGVAITSSPTISATAARVGTSGLLCTAAATYGRGFTSAALFPSGTFDGATASSALVCSIGCSLRWPVMTFTTGNNVGCRISGDGDNHVEIETVNTETLRVAIRSLGQTDKFATLTTVLSANAWYGVVVRVDAVNNKFAIELYDDTDTLIEAVENTSETLGAQMPWFSSSSSGFQVSANVNASNTHIDNVIVSSVYSAKIEDNFQITHYNQYDEVGVTGATLTPNPSSLSV